jgi:hypothetical protein
MPGAAGVYGVAKNELPNAARAKALNYGFLLYFLVFILFSRTPLISLNPD